jgi:hypothetical protein
VNYVSLRTWSGKFQSPATIRKIRRCIRAWIDLGVCVAVLDDGAVGITPEIRAELQRDWPSGKVIFSRPHPSATWTRSKRNKRRRQP